MARLSLGKNTGSSSKKTSQRLLGGITMGSGGGQAVVQGAKIETPTLKPQAEALNFYGTTSVPNAPGVIDIPAPPELPQSPAQQNALNMKGWLGDLQTNLSGAVSETLKWDAARIKDAQREAESIVGQYPPGKGPDDELKSISQQMDKILANPKDKNDKPVYTIEERKGAEKIKGRLAGTGVQGDRVKRFIKSELTKQGVINNALNLSQSAIGATIDDVDENNNPIKVPLESLSADDPRYLAWAKTSIHGDTKLNPYQYEDVKPQLVNALAQDRARQNKAKVKYDTNKLIEHRNLKLDTVAMNLSKNKDGYVVEATKELQLLLDKTLLIAPHLSQEAQTKLKEDLPELLLQAYLRHNKGGDETLIKTVLQGLMTGPIESRYITTTEKIDGVDVITEQKINEKQRWINQFGGDSWLNERMSDARYDLREIDGKNDLAGKSDGENSMDTLIEEKVIPLINAGKFEEASLAVDEIKKNYLSTSKDSAIVTAHVIGYTDKTYKNLLQVDSIQMQSDMSRISRSAVRANLSVKNAASIMLEINAFEKRYAGRKDAVDFAVKIREKIDFSKLTDFKERDANLNTALQKIEKDWNKYSTTKNSYGGADTAKESTMWMSAEIKAKEKGQELILKFLKGDITQKEFDDQMLQILNRKSLGLLYEAEQPWTPERGTTWPGNTDTSLSNMETKYGLNKTTLNRNDRQALNTAVKDSKPIFDPETISEIADRALTGKPGDKLDPRLIRILKETNMKAGDFILQQMEKFNGYIKITPEVRAALLNLNKIKIK